MKQFLNLVWLMVFAISCVNAAPRIEIVRAAFVPGGFLLGRVPVGSSVEVGNVKVSVGNNGLFGFGFDRYADLQQAVKVCLKQDECLIERFALDKREYKTQSVRGVANQHVNPSTKQNRRIEEDNAAVSAVRKQVTGSDDFVDQFMLPVSAPTSGVYGSRRLYNGEERSWHKGHDLAAKVGDLVKAPAGGVVRMTRDTFMAGNLLILDHGGGFFTVYAHLNSFNVKVGQRVEQGEVIAEVGTTGRSTGPHLHWGMYWKNIAIDPMLWVGNK